MKVQVLHVAAETPQGYKWIWRSDDGAVESSSAFDFFYDCVADARARGHDV